MFVWGIPLNQICLEFLIFISICNLLLTFQTFPSKDYIISRYCLIILFHSPVCRVQRLLPGIRLIWNRSVSLPSQRKYRYPFGRRTYPTDQGAYWCRLWWSSCHCSWYSHSTSIGKWIMFVWISESFRPMLQLIISLPDVLLLWFNSCWLFNQIN